MPPRVGPSGAITKPSASSKGQAIAKSVTNKVIDLTLDSTDESGEQPADESVEELTGGKQSEDASADGIRHGGSVRRIQQHAGSGPQGASRASAAVQSDYILEDMFIVTGI